MGFGMTSSAGSLLGGEGRTGNKIPSGYKSGRIQQFTPEQMQLFKQMFSNVSPNSFLSRLAGGDQSQFEQTEAPALRQFSELQGNIASRFSGMGMGGRRSSGFQNTMNQAASNFAQDLQSRRQGLQRQAIMDLMGLSGDLLGQRPYQNLLVPKQQSGFSSALSSLGSGLGAGLTGGLSAGLSSGIGNWLSGSQNAQGSAGASLGRAF